MPDPSKAVLITGCSSGIGAATALVLKRSGWTVYATARRPETLAELERAGCVTLALDVTDEDSMRAAVDQVGTVGVLINNAGYSQSGAVESVPVDDVRRQFETNVFGLIRLTQLVLPGMRAQRWGKVVNIGSMGGRLTFPGGGIYHATKYALEALSDALRFELRGFGIDVILIEPGLIVTRFGETAAGSVQDSEGPYADFNRTVAKRTENVYRGPLARLGGPPDAVAETIAKALDAKRPKARYRVTPSARIMIGQRRVLPDAAWDAMMRTQFPTPRS
ncbi:MAG TPA: oxidoreductase [Solirubrobacteraceae bacterium]|nr:oxidoreductase [Solirubrobacteraceae bacterium]